MRYPYLPAAGLQLFSLVLAATSDADPPRLHTALGAALPVTGYHTSEFGWGAGLTMGMELPFVPQFGVAAILGVLVLADGAKQTADNFVEQGAATAYSGVFATYLRPYASSDPQLMHGLSGVWLSASFGAAHTGTVQRFVADGSFGYDVLIGDGTYGLGPYLRLLHVFQPDSELRGADANILVFGAHLSFDGADRTPLDFDGDGVADRLDQCPEQREDVDRVADDDGCPEPDGDAVVDAASRQPLGVGARR